jgi:hypothetical protein
MAETAAIKTERPLYNKTLNANPVARPSAGLRLTAAGRAATMGAAGGNMDRLRAFHLPTITAQRHTVTIEGHRQ